MRKAGVWSDAPQDVVPSELPLRADLVWIADAFYDLAAKRRWTGGGFAILPDPIETSRIREHFFDELGMTGATGYARFRRLIDRLDADWRDDWTEREEERRRRQDADDAIRRRRQGA